MLAAARLPRAACVAACAACCCGGCCPRTASPPAWKPRTTARHSSEAGTAAGMAEGTAARPQCPAVRDGRQQRDCNRCWLLQQRETAIPALFPRLPATLPTGRPRQAGPPRPSRAHAAEAAQAAHARRAARARRLRAPTVICPAALRCRAQHQPLAASHGLCRQAVGSEGDHHLARTPLPPAFPHREGGEEGRSRCRRPGSEARTSWRGTYCIPARIAAAQKSR